jgi:hypothetical protein
MNMRRALLAIRSLRWLSVEIRRIALLRTHQVSQAVFGSASARHEDLKDRDYTGVLYIGLGDQFDDDRRLVREAASALRPATRPTWAGASPPVVISAGSRPPAREARHKW